MSAAFVASWPGSRVLLGWWRELAPRKPQQLRLSRLLLHRVEALVRVARSRPLDRWQRALLSLAGTRVPCGELISSLTDLQMDVQVLGRLIHELTHAGLLERNGAGLWRITPAGRHALNTGAAAVTAEERRTFPFVDNAALGRLPHFLPLDLGPARFPGAAAPEADACSFDAACLEESIRQSPAWKSRFRFPADVQALVPPRAGDAPADWRRVILDAVEERFLVCIQTAQKPPARTLFGFAVRPEGWAMEPGPLLELADGWQEALPDLTADASREAWRQAWQTWSQPRGLPPAEVEACRFERVDHRLVVHAPARLIDRLRAARSDAIKQEAWLLAGEGRTRFAAQLELQPL